MNAAYARPSLVGSLACATAILAGCGGGGDAAKSPRPERPQAGRAVVRVGHSAIPRSEFDRRYRAALRQLSRVGAVTGVTRRHLARRAKENLLTDAIWKEWIEQEAARRGIEPPGGARRSEARVATLEAQLTKREHLDAPPSAEEIRSFYQANRAAFAGPLDAVRNAVVDMLEDRKASRARELLQTRLRTKYLPATRCSQGYHSVWCGPRAAS